MRPVEGGYFELLKNASPEQKRVASFALVELTWKTFLFKWELDNRRGTIRTFSDQGVDLYKKCRELLVDERASAVRQILKSQSVASTLLEQRLRQMKAEVYNGFGLTNIMGEAISFACQAWDLVPVNLHTALPQVATTSSHAGTIVVNGLIMEAQKAATGDLSEDVFKRAIAWSSEEKCREFILARMAQEREKGNSSGNLEVAGCPALGTPAFMGSRQLVLDLKRKIGF